MPVYILTKSKRKGKRFVLVKNGKGIHFGSDVGRTFVDHGRENIKKAWFARHKMDKGFDNKDLASVTHLLRSVQASAWRWRQPTKTLRGGSYPSLVMAP